LYTDQWDGSKWTWALPLGNPGGGVHVFGDVAVSNYKVPGGVHENVYVPGNDGSLDLDFFDGTNFNWVNLGVPTAPSHPSQQSQSAQEWLIDAAIASLAPLAVSKKHLAHGLSGLLQSTLFPSDAEVFRP
jgi:hypothetical protein